MGSQTLLLAECLFAWTETGSSMAGGQDPISDCPLCASTSHSPSFTSQSQPGYPVAPVFSLGHTGICLFPPLWGLQTLILWVGKGWYINSFYVSSGGNQLHRKVPKSKPHHHKASSSLDRTQKAEEWLTHVSHVRKALTCQGDFPFLLL